MSSSFWSKVRTRYCKHLTPLYTSILGVGGEKHPICDRVELKIKIGNKLVSQDFHILQGHHDVILGVDFLNQHGVILDYAKGTLIFQDQQIPFRPPHAHSALVRTSRSTVIDPQHETWVPMTLSKTPNTQLLVESVSSFDSHFPDLVFVPGVHMPNKSSILCKVRGSRGSVSGRALDFRLIGVSTCGFESHQGPFRSLTFPPVLRDWVIKGFGMSSLVYATGHIKDPVPLVEKSRGLSPGGRFPPSFIHQVIIITGLNKLQLYVLALKMALDADRA